MSLVKIQIINLLKSRRTVLFLCIQTLGFFLYMSLLRFYNDLYFDYETLSLYNVDFVENNLLSYYGIGIYLITGGILLWSFILIDVYVALKGNDHSGILLTQIVNPITRTGYFIRLMLSIYLTYLFLTFINLLISVIIVIFLFQLFNINLISIALASFLYICVISLAMYLVFSLLCILINQSELYLLTCSLIMIFSNLSFLLKFVTVRYQVSKVLSIVINLNSDLFLFFINRFNVFKNYNEPIYNWLSRSISQYSDPDLGVIPETNIVFIERNGWIAFSISLIVILVLYLLNIRRFKKLDIAGH